MKTNCLKLTFASLLLLISILSNAQSIKEEYAIIGLWKNCGSYTLNSNTIVLYRQWTDSCDAYGDCCDQSIWKFVKKGDVNPDLGNLLHIELTASCKTKIKLACTGRKNFLTWTVNEEKNSLVIEENKKKTFFIIKSLDMNHLYLIKQ
ncbi:MAG: hypothetical protein JST26_13205 [Bacteroidetes bacterium]|nr:hypothetical protein [Bacteroidota bacterium]